MKENEREEGTVECHRPGTLHRRGKSVVWTMDVAGLGKATCHEMTTRCSRLHERQVMCALVHVDSAWAQSKPVCSLLSVKQKEGPGFKYPLSSQSPEPRSLRGWSQEPRPTVPRAQAACARWEKGSILPSGSLGTGQHPSPFTPMSHIHTDTHTLIHTDSNTHSYT